MAKRFQTHRKNYLNISSKGYLYKKSDRESYEKDISEGKNYIKEFYRKDGSVYYHDIYSSTEDGYIDFLGISEKEVINNNKKVKLKNLVISINNGNESDVVSVPLYYPKGGLTILAKNIILTLANVDFSEKMNISCSSFKNDKGYENTYVFFNRVDKKGTNQSFVKSTFKYGEDIPNAEEKESFDGSKTKSYEKQDTFIYNVLIQQIERFKKFNNINSIPDKENIDENLNTYGMVKNIPTSTPHESFDPPVNEFNELDQIDELPF